MIHLYAIAEEPPPEDLTGIDGVPVRAAGRAGLYAAYSELDGQPGTDAEALLAHERVVEALMRRGPVLPVRFGTELASEDELLGELARRGAGFGEQLAHVRGCVELGVRGEETPADLARLARESVVRSEGEVAYLVPERDVAAFRRRAEAAGARCSGPWPPYSFATPPAGAAPRQRIAADPEGLERGLAQLVLTIVELLRQLMERQALRRIDGGGLSEEQVERLDRTFMLLERRMQELKDTFGLEDRDLNLDLGPLGRLL
jgi:hypothetical protein